MNNSYVVYEKDNGQLLDVVESRQPSFTSFQAFALRSLYIIREPKCRILWLTLSHHLLAQSRLRTRKFGSWKSDRLVLSKVLTVHNLYLDSERD